MHEDPQPHKEKQTKHMITDVHAHTHAGEHIRVQIISQRLTQVLSPTSPPHLLPTFSLSSVRSPCPQTLLRILIHHPLLSLSLPLHHSLSLLNTDRLSTPWSEFQISSPSVAEPLQKNSNIKEETAEVNSLG